MEIKTVTPLSAKLPARDDHSHVGIDEKSVPRTVEVPFDLSSLSEPEVDANAAMVAKMKGKVLETPNMLSLMKGWPEGQRNKHYERLRDFYIEAIDSVVPDPQRGEKFKRCDFAAFCALWWPNAEWDDFLCAGYFVLWIFIWDDTLDANDNDISDDFEQADLFRRQTIDFAKLSLRLWEESDGPEPTSPSPTCDLFKDYADTIVQKLTKDRREQIYTEVVRYIDECAVEQSHRLAGYVPTLDEYIHNRMGTSAVDILCAFYELFLDTQLPDCMYYSPEMRVIWRESNLAIILINDILSLRKEMVTDCVINIVPVLYHQGMAWDNIVPELMEELRAVSERLDKAEGQLMRAAGDDARLTKNLKIYVDACRTSCTGTFIYTTESARYKIASFTREDRSARITL